MTGWITTIAWHTSTMAVTYLNALLILSLVSLNWTGYVPQTWHTVLVFYAIIALAVAVTTIGARIYPKFEALSFVLHITGFFTVLIILVYLAPKNSPAEVFQNFNNGGAFKSDGESWFVGTTEVMFSFIGMVFTWLQTIS